MRILFVTSTRVGDAVLSSGLLSYLIDSYPGARITIACGPAAADLFRSVPGLERLIVLEKMIGSLHWLRLWVLCVGIWWDLVVDLRNAPLTYFLPASTQRHLRRNQKLEHRLIQISSVLGLETNPRTPRLWVSEADLISAKKLIPELPSYSLKSLLIYFKIECKNLHRAHNDILALKLVYQKLCGINFQVLY